MTLQKNPLFRTRGIDHLGIIPINGSMKYNGESSLLHQRKRLEDNNRATVCWILVGLINDGIIDKQCCQSLFRACKQSNFYALSFSNLRHPDSINADHNA